MTHTLTVGPAGHCRGGSIQFGYYGNGETAITIMRNGEREAVATVNLEDYGVTAPPGHVWLKGWSENRGIPEALEQAGILKLTGETVPAGHATAQLAELSDKAIEAANEGVTA